VSSTSLFAQVAWLALLASVSPPALLLAGLYLRSEQPGRITLFFVVGGLFVVSVVGTVALVVMRAGGLSHLGHHQTRYGLRLGLGVIALIAALVLYLREPKPRDQGKKPKKPKLVQRLSAQPRPVTAFAVGVFMFGPSLAFISAVQVVATARTGLADTIGAMALIIVLAVAFAWLPFLAYLLAPDRTLRLLHSLEGALAKHGRAILIAAIGIIGTFLVIQGITGLVLAAGFSAVVASPARDSSDRPGGSASSGVPLTIAAYPGQDMTTPPELVAAHEGAAWASVKVASRRKAQRGSSRTVIREGKGLGPGDTITPTVHVTRGAGRVIPLVRVPGPVPSASTAPGVRRGAGTGLR